MPSFSIEFWIGMAFAVLALIVGLGVTLGMDARTRGELRFAVTCFLISAAILLYGIEVWQVTTPRKNRIFIYVSVALVIILTGEAIRWAQGRHHRAFSQGEGPASGTPSATPTPVPPPSSTTENYGTTDKAEAEAKHHGTSDSTDATVKHPSSGPPESIAPNAGLNLREVPASELGYKNTIPDTFTVEVGTNKWTFQTSEMKKQFPFTRMTMIDVGKVPFTINFDDKNNLQINATVYQSKDTVGAVIKNNDFAVVDTAWDRNWDATAFEIVDEHQIPIFQIDRSSWGVLHIRGTFIAENGNVFFINDREVRITPTGPVEPPLRIFVYPGNAHFHERASVP